MSIFKKRNKREEEDYYSVLSDHYVPRKLPSFGARLESFVTSDYQINDRNNIETAYAFVEEELGQIIQTCDSHVSGEELDQYIDVQIDSYIATVEATEANNKSQVCRINAAQSTRRQELERKIPELEKQIEKLKIEIEPMEALRSQFQIHIGSFQISVGFLVTIIAMVLDAAVNYSFLQNILLSNTTLLIITVASMSLMSDASMCALGVFLSRKDENFTTKKLFMTACIGFISMFLLSVVASIMMRYGSMQQSYGSIDANGNFVGKGTYSLAEYGVTLMSAFVTTATGLLSFAFSLDKNVVPVAIREEKKKELKIAMVTKDLYTNELLLLENRYNPKDWDEGKKAAAMHQIESLRLGLKLHCRKLLTIKMNDPDFTERMFVSGKELVKNILDEKEKKKNEKQ